MKFDLNNKTNRFAQRTLADFSNTLFSLLETKPFEKITVNEICKDCNYPRATFYNYFDDSYDLLNYCWIAMMKEMEIDGYVHLDSEQRTEWIFDRIYDYFSLHQERLNKIMRVNPMDGALVISCILFVKQQTIHIMMDCPNLSSYSIPYQLVAEHFSNTIQLVIEWCFFRNQIHSKEEAKQCLRCLLKGNYGNV